MTGQSQNNAMKYIANISLPFAELKAVASCSDATDSHCLLTLVRANVQPSLPPGMSVDFATSVIGTLSAKTAIHCFHFSLRLASRVINCGPESGESLDAQSFKIGNSLVMIGTEDGEMLASRHRWIKVTPKQYPIGYLEDGFELVLDFIPPNSNFDFHFVIAFNSVASTDCSEWFAVDIAHRQLLALPSDVIPASST